MAKKRKLGFEEQLIQEDFNSQRNIQKDFKRDLRDFGGGNRRRSPTSCGGNSSKHVIVEDYGHYENRKKRELYKKENQYLFLGGLAFILIGLFTFKNSVGTSIFLILFGVFLSYLGNKRSRK